MEKKILAVLAFAALACTAALAEKTFTVSSMDQFLRAVGPDRTIVMKPGTYAIKKSSNVKSQYFRWDEAGDGGNQLTIQDASNLTIKAQSSDVGIIASTAYAYVLAFENCETVTLEGLTMGHEASEPCMAGVVYFSGSSYVTVESCDLYGSGSWGVFTAGCSEVTLSNTTIRDCSSSAAWITDSSGIYFTDCTITANAAYPLFYVENTDYVAFTTCTISDNMGDTAVTVAGETMASVEFTECSLSYNDIAEFRPEGEESYVAFTDCALEGNAFGDDADAIVDGVSGATEEGYDEVEEPLVYTHEPAGLTFLVPASWDEPVENEDGEALQVTDEENVTGIILAPLYTLPEGANVKKNAKRYLDEGLKGFIAYMKEQDATASVKLDGDVFDIEGMPTADFRGDGQYDQTDDLTYWVRLVIAGGRVWGFIGISDSEEPLAPESELAYLMDSITAAPY